MSEQQKKVLARFYLGGFDAITGFAKYQTINTLIRLGLFCETEKRLFLTKKGREEAKRLADSGVI